MVLSVEVRAERKATREQLWAAELEKREAMEAPERKAYMAAKFEERKATALAKT